MEYRDGRGGVLRELVRAEALADPFVSSLIGVPVVCEHPTDASGRDIEVDWDNTPELRVGTIVDAVLTRGCQVKITAVIDTAAGRSYVRDQKVSGLSPHYHATVIPVDGGNDPLYGRYDSMQINRERPDHVAIVMSPRGDAHGTHLRLDSAGRLASPLSKESPVELSEQMLRDLMGDDSLSADDLIAKLRAASKEEPAADMEEQDADPEKSMDADESKMDMSAMAERLDMLAEKMDAMCDAVADAVMQRMADRYDMKARADEADGSDESAHTDSDNADKGAESKRSDSADETAPSERVRIDAQAGGDPLVTLTWI